jgi:hypothetical protein
MTDCAWEAFSGFPKLRLRCADLERLLSTREVLSLLPLARPLRRLGVVNHPVRDGLSYSVRCLPLDFEPEEAPDVD